MIHYSWRMILRGDTDSAKRSVQEYAERYGWDGTTIPEDPASGTIEESIWQVSEDVAVHFMSDDFTRRPYVFAAADSINSCHAMQAHLQNHLNPVPQSELLADLENSTTPDERRRAILSVALGGPNQDNEIVISSIDQSLRDESAEVRKAAVFATTYSPSSRYIPMLTEALRNDASVEVREEARTILDIYEQLDIQ